MKYLFVFISLCQSILYSQAKKETDSISYYNELANYNIKINNLSQALLYTEKSIYYCEVYKQNDKLIDQTLQLGKIYYYQKSYPLAVQNFYKVISLIPQKKPSKTVETINHYSRILNIEKEEYPTKTNFVYHNNSDKNLLLKIANDFEAKKEYNSAITIYQKIIKTTDSTSVFSKAEAFYRLGLIESETKQNDTAISHFEKALELNTKIDNLAQKSDIILAISRYYKETKDFDKAYNYLEKYSQLKNQELHNQNTKSDLLAYKKNELINSEKEKENKIKENLFKYSKLINILAVSLISILSLLSLSLYRNNIIRNRNNITLKEKNSELIIAKNKAEEASKTRSEFLSTVSHELRTPLNAINGITHILIEDNPKPSQITYLESLKFSGNYLTTFINEILEINKIDSNKLEVDNVNFNLKELLTNIQVSLKSLAITNNNKLTFKIDPEIPDYLTGDSTKLSQIILNLVNNALKFTQNGIVDVIIKLQEIKNENVVIYFEVTDTGIGIPKDKLKTVFERFSQGSIEVNRKYGGTGLGLAIVKKLVQVLEGKIKLKSELGKGSTFTFKLKFGINKQSLVVEKTKQTYDDTIFENKKILLIEDNKINQMITEKMLKNKKMICQIIESGEEAIETIRNTNFDLILMDVHLPGISGTTATQHIREFNKSTPIIALTAISLYENREILLSYGMDEVITKPFAPEEFYSCIAKYLQ